MTNPVESDAMLAKDDYTGSLLPTESRAPASAWYALAILIATTLFAYVDRQIINLVSPALQKDLGLTDFQLGVMQGLGLALFASAAAYPIGWLSDRYGRRLVLGCCIMIWSISTAACGFQTSFFGIFIATGGIAIGEAALTPVIFSMMPDLFPERQRNTANFIYFGVALLGAGIGLGFGGATLSLLATHQQALPSFLASLESWRVALILVALPGPFFALLLATIPMRDSGGRASHPASGGQGPNLGNIGVFVRAHWRSFACIYAASLAYNMPLSATFAWLPIAIPRAFEGVDASSVGIQLGIAVGIGSVVGLLLPPIGMKLLGGDATVRPLRLASILLGLVTVPTFLMLFAWEPWQVYAIAAAELAALLATGALMPGVLQQLAPEHLRSRLISVIGITAAVASGLGPMIVGALSGLFDAHRGPIIAMVAVSLPAWAAAALLISASRRPAAATIAAIASADAEDR